MKTNIQTLKAALAAKGVFLDRNVTGTFSFSDLAMDAQSVLNTTTNAGIPAWLANYVDPTIIDIAFTPMKAAEIAPEVKIGDWVTLTAMFPVGESTGNIATYDDYSNDGGVGANVNWVPRQSFHYQTIAKFGDREVEMAAQGNINQVAEVEKAAMLTMAKFQNKSYFYGVTGMQCYGLLNDASLSTPIAPSGSGAAQLWSAKQPETIANDVTALFKQLVTQTKGLIDMDTPMVLAMSPVAQTNFANTNSYGLSARAKIKENYPNMEFVTAAEYSTAGGELLQLYAKSLNGKEVAQTAFTEKLRTFAPIRAHSSVSAKRTGGTWGAIIKQPLGISQMLGV